MNADTNRERHQYETGEQGAGRRDYEAEYRALRDRANSPATPEQERLIARLIARSMRAGTSSVLVEEEQPER